MLLDRAEFGSFTGYSTVYRGSLSFCYSGKQADIMLVNNDEGLFLVVAVRSG